MSKEFPQINPINHVLLMEKEGAASEGRIQENPIYTVIISGGDINPINIIVRKYRLGDAAVK